MTHGSAPPRRLRVLAIAGAAALLVLCALAVTFFMFAAPRPCGNKLLSRSTSPDGKRDAMVFNRSCGAKTPVYTEISIVPAGAPLENAAGNLLGSDTDHGRAPSAPARGPTLHVRWNGPKELEVAHHRKARVFRDANTEVDVRYVTFDSCPPPAPVGPASQHRAFEAIRAGLSYPAEACAEGRDGTVVVSFRAVDGVPFQVEIRKTSGDARLDHAVLIAASRAKALPDSGEVAVIFETH
jgi:TonB family protein